MRRVREEPYIISTSMRVVGYLCSLRGGRGVFTVLPEASCIKLGRDSFLCVTNVLAVYGRYF